jgi:hypothetical protein
MFSQIFKMKLGKKMQILNSEKGVHKLYFQITLTIFEVNNYWNGF